MSFGKRQFQKIAEGRDGDVVPAPELNYMRREVSASGDYDPQELSLLAGDDIDALYEEGVTEVLRLTGVEEKPELGALALKLRGEGGKVMDVLINVEDVDKLADVVKAIGKYIEVPEEK